MKIFLAKLYPFHEVKIYKNEFGYTSSGILFPVNTARFENAHVYCKHCDRFCALLKEKFQQNSCDTDYAELEFKICLDLATTTFSIRVVGDILGALPTFVGLHENTWVKIGLMDITHGPVSSAKSLRSVASQRIILEKGKCLYEVQMNCLSDWIDFFMGSSPEETLRGVYSVMFGTDNLTESEVSLRMPKDSNLLALNSTILEKQIATDLVLTSASGTKFPCHRCFLTAHSTSFEAMLKDKNLVEGETNEIAINDITESGLKALLKFLYCRDIKEPTVNPSIAIELLTCGNKYGIDVLVHSLREILLGKPIDWFDQSTAIRLFYYGCQHESQIEFKRKALQVLRLKSLEEVWNSTDYKELSSENPEAAQELYTALYYLS